MAMEVRCVCGLRQLLNCWGVWLILLRRPLELAIATTSPSECVVDRVFFLD